MGITASGEACQVDNVHKEVMAECESKSRHNRQQGARALSPEKLAGLHAWALLAIILALHQDLAAPYRCHLEFRCGGPPGRVSEQQQPGASHPARQVWGLPLL